MSLSRRGLLAISAAALCRPAGAQPVTTQITAPSAGDAGPWIAYESRLRARLTDAGGGRFDAAGARAILDLANDARVAVGAEPVAWHDELALAARAHAGDLARRGDVEHLSPEGFDPSHRFWLLSRTTIGSPSENIAYHHGDDGPVAPPQLLKVWQRSPGHWGNLLRPSHTHAAFGLVRTAGHAWLVGLFARPLAILSEPLPLHASAEDRAKALGSVASELRPRVSAPQGCRPSEASPPPVLQITAIRRVETGAFDVIGGPIFVSGA